MSQTQGAVYAAGVVLLRDGAAGPETLVVHRPHRSDWSLPKGKLEPGEHVVAAAVRECDEETGVTPVLGLPLARLEYIAMGAEKIVDYWVARAGEEVRFTPDDEIDQIRWVSTAKVGSLLTYHGDAELVAQATALPITVPLIILRHTQALKRSNFDGEDDQERPLTGKGRSQAKSLVPLLSAYGITQVHSSVSTRCTETVRRFAKTNDLRVKTETAISEEDHHIRPKAAMRLVRKLAMKANPTVICTHRPVLPSVMEAVAETLDLDPNDAALDPKLSPGSFIVIHRTFAADGAVRMAGVERHDLVAT